MQIKDINKSYDNNKIYTLTGTITDFREVPTKLDYTKILITPGIVELGDKQYAENKNFILYANDKTDYILIVGKTNKEALMEGNKNSIYFDKIEQAINYALNNINGNKKIILLENDLPDNY